MEAVNLKITLANESLAEPSEIAEALERAAGEIAETGNWQGTIRNDLGAEIGSYSLWAEPVDRGEAIRADRVEAGMRVKPPEGRGYHEIKRVSAGRNEGQIVLHVAWGSVELAPDAACYVLSTYAPTGPVDADLSDAEVSEQEAQESAG